MALKTKFKVSRTTHGMAGTKIYALWSEMIKRCHSPNSKSYKWYGAKGIYVCQEWRSSFQSFYSCMGSMPVGMSLDRIDARGPYSPTNCRWANAKTQARNTTRNAVYEFKGVSMPLVAWAEKFGLKPVTLHARLSNGWSIEKSLNTPLINRGWDKRFARGQA